MATCMSKLKTRSEKVSFRVQNKIPRIRYRMLWIFIHLEDEYVSVFSAYLSITDDENNFAIRTNITVSIKTIHTLLSSSYLPKWFRMLVHNPTNNFYDWFRCLGEAPFYKQSVWLNNSKNASFYSFKDTIRHSYTVIFIEFIDILMTRWTELVLIFFDRH
jgi:hypothetical protein